jgi:hypothetical protein
VSHALYRKGTPENLAHDFVIMMAVAKGRNDTDTIPKLKQFLDIVWRHKPTNVGEITTGSVHQVGIDGVAAGIFDTALINAAFADVGTLVEVLKEVKQAGLGLSVTVSGLFDVVHECCHRAGLEPYGIEESLGIIGQTGLLPPEPLVEVATMCGHSLVSYRLIDLMVEQIKAGQVTSAAAALTLAQQCVCGIFNPARAQTLLEAMAG